MRKSTNYIDGGIF